MLFRVPLDAEHEAGQAAQLGGPGLDRLDQAVFLPRDRPQPVAEQVDGLVVMGGHLDEPGLGQDAGQHAVRADLYVVPPEPARPAVVPLMVDQVRHVLVQRAAPAHVQHLHAAADRQQRHALGHGRAGDGQVPGVADRPGRLGLRVARLAVPGRIDVRAARHDQAVQVRDRQAGLVGVPAGRQQDRPAAAAAHRVHVHVREKRGPGVPVMPRSRVVV